MNEKEYRVLSNKITRGANGRTVEGYAMVYEQPSEDMGFIETIKTGAISQDTIANSDIFARLNHDDDHVLARSKDGKGSLKLSIDEMGLKYSFEAPMTSQGDELLSYLDRGEITQSSFAFCVSQDEGSERWYNDENGNLHRDIFKIEKLFDVSPVFQPAYSMTTCNKRYLQIKDTILELENEIDEIEKL
jgi:HK97 family phage prohead protease